MPVGAGGGHGNVKQAGRRRQHNTLCSSEEDTSGGRVGLGPELPDYPHFQEKM